MKLGEKIGAAIWGVTGTVMLTMLVLVMTGLERGGATTGNAFVAVMGGGFLLGLIAIYWPLGS